MVSANSTSTNNGPVAELTASASWANGGFAVRLGDPRVSETPAHTNSIPQRSCSSNIGGGQSIAPAGENSTELVAAGCGWCDRRTDAHGYPFGPVIPHRSIWSHGLCNCCYQRETNSYYEVGHA